MTRGKFVFNAHLQYVNSAKLYNEKPCESIYLGENIYSYFDYWNINYMFIYLMSLLLANTWKIHMY